MAAPIPLPWLLNKKLAQLPESEEFSIGCTENWMMVNLLDRPGRDSLAFALSEWAKMNRIRAAELRFDSGRRLMQ
jgi:hypothetical protein